MHRAVARVIAVVYGVSLAFAYFVHNPPQWLDRVAVSTGIERTIRLFGHEVRMGIHIRRERPESPTPAAELNLPWMGRVPIEPGRYYIRDGPHLTRLPSVDGPAHGVLESSGAAPRGQR